MKGNRLIVVLGMHRSGTSAITRVLQTMGVHLGDNLMPAIEGINDKGFWEDLDINVLNVEILDALGSDWHHLSPLQDADVELLREKGFFLRAVELLRRKMEKSGVFGFKDPRVPRLMPFWKKVFASCNCSVGYVIAVRHPLSVVRSLAMRDNFATEKSYLLWLGHVIPSLSHSLDENMLVVDYDQLMKSPSREAKRIAEHFGLILDQEELLRYESDFLDHALRHTVFDLKDLVLDTSCPPLVREIYTLVLKLATGTTASSAIDLKQSIEQWAEQYHILQPCLALADTLMKSAALCDGQLEIFQEKAGNLEEKVKAGEAEITRLVDKVMHLEARLNEKEQHLERVEQTLQGIYRLRGWQILSRLYQVKAKLLPNERSHNLGRGKSE